MSRVCHEIHRIFNSIKRYNFPFNLDEIPLNGIYVLFEKGEFAHSDDRIVRIGTHTGKNQLRSRLNQHFVNEKKDRSIFRKNIGRAILYRNNDPFIHQWEIDLTPKSARQKYEASIDFHRQKEVEKEVTNYIQNKFSFIVFSIEDRKNRLELESKIISTISWCDECQHSNHWLGIHSPKLKIRKSGLWQVNGLYKEPLSEEDLNYLISVIQL